MQGLSINLLLAQTFIPHGHCYLWKPGLVWLHVISDTLTAAAYYSIPLALFFLVRNRKDLPFNWIFLLFGSFIIACGTTHILEVWTLWHPIYWISGGVKALTATVSMYTAMMSVPLVPRVLALPSPVQLEAANRELEREIRDREQVEAALRKSEALLTEAQHIARIGNWELDPVHHSLTWSQEQFRLLNRDPALGEPTYPDSLALYHPTDAVQLDAAMQQAIATGTPYKLTVRVDLPDRTTRVLNIAGYAETDTNGNVIRLYGTTQDITEQTLLEQKLTEKQQLLDALINTAPIGFCMLNNQLQFTLVNPALAEINGVAIADHLHKTPWDVVPDLAAQQAEIFMRVLETGTSIKDVELIGETPKLIGVKRAWLASYFPVHTAQQTLMGIGLVIVEITDLRDAAEKIKISLKEKEVLLQEIHHRVKNNLQIVDGLIQMQVRRSHDLNVIAVLRDSQSRIASIALVHEKLYCSDTLANIDFAYYLPDLTAHLFESYKISSSQIQLILKVEPILVDIETAIPCGLIINELVSNALKYAFPDNREGIIQIEFYQGHRPTSPPQLELFVRDNGIGLPADFQIQNTRSLGMTLVQGLVEQLEGVLEIRYQPGAEFKITFPKP